MRRRKSELLLTPRAAREDERERERERGRERKRASEEKRTDFIRRCSILSGVNIALSV